MCVCVCVITVLSQTAASAALQQHSNTKPQKKLLSTEQDKSLSTTEDMNSPSLHVQSTKRIVLNTTAL